MQLFALSASTINFYVKKNNSVAIIHHDNIRWSVDVRVHEGINRVAALL